MAAPLIRLRWTPRSAVVGMLFAMVVFGSNFAISRYSVQHGLRPYDLVTLRFGVAGVLLLPYLVWRGGPNFGGLGWGKAIVLAVTSGMPVVFFISLGTSMAPAAHGAALAPGTVTVVGVVYAMILAGALPPRLTQLGLVLALSGLVTMAVAGTTSHSPTVLLGDLSYFVSGLLWGFYPILLHRWQVGGMLGAAICAVLSLVYVPFYVLFLDPRLLDIPVGLLIALAIYQGVINHIVGLWVWGQGVRVLGAHGTQFFPPLIPVVGTLMAIPILGEWPAPLATLGIVLIVGGIALSTLGNRLGPLRKTDSSTGS